MKYANAMCEASVDLEKAELILSELINKYDWDYDLDLHKGLTYACKLHQKDEVVDQVGKLTWVYVYDYRKIMRFISIALDYVFEAIQCMENVEGGAEA